jgi:hypothetical protein
MKVLGQSEVGGVISLPGPETNCDLDRSGSIFQRMADYREVAKPLQPFAHGVSGQLLVEHELGDSADDLIPDQEGCMQVRVGFDPVHELPMNVRRTFIGAGQSDEQAGVDNDAQGQRVSRSAGSSRTDRTTSTASTGGRPSRRAAKRSRARRAFRLLSSWSPCSLRKRSHALLAMAFAPQPIILQTVDQIKSGRASPGRPSPRRAGRTAAARPGRGRPALRGRSRRCDEGQGTRA